MPVILFAMAGILVDWRFKGIRGRKKGVLFEVKICCFSFVSNDKSISCETTIMNRFPSAPYRMSRLPAMSTKPRMTPVSPR